MYLAGCTIFLSAFLLFLVQPLIGKFILPWFGGAASVWTTCMLFFQVLLLLGYWYADWLVQRLSRRGRIAVHSLIGLCAALALLGRYGFEVRPEGDTSPEFFIILFLAGSIGLPYFLLSSSAPLIQGILGKQSSSLKIYRLYALSNAASLLALVSYPLVLEPGLSIHLQLLYWRVAFLFYLFCILAFLFKSSETASVNKQSSRILRIDPARQLNWFLYSALGCMVLLSSTNHICQNIASVPFLWILPLTLYLLSFIIAFSKTGAYARNLYFLIFLFSCATLLWLEQAGTPALIPLLISSALIVFSACMICHGELARDKPETDMLTRYYLIMSAGSVAGSLFIVLLAPLLFDFYTEFPLTLMLCAWIAVRSRARLSNSAMSSFLLCLALIFIAVFYERYHAGIAETRNFYGVLQVKEKNPENSDFHFYRMFHGEVVHGLQFQSPDKRKIPTTYYGEQSGIGRLLKNYQSDQPRNIGAVGLGVGTIASSLNASDHIRFYEINPSVIDFAKQYFSFLQDSPAREISYVLGDGRLQLNAEQSNNFDILLLDAFSGDSVPIHLLTFEALEEYKHQLSPSGVLVFHLTNFYLDLVPLVGAAAEENNMQCFYVKDKGEKTLGQAQSEYLVCSTAKNLDALEKALSPAPLVRFGGHLFWRDDFSNLLSALR